ncbi:MAG: Sensor kinase CckA [Opitutia bacterium UBA7350]|nr:MAG: Sensor kinase CckA [Opitutae bacterium UBA7350]
MSKGSSRDLVTKEDQLPLRSLVHDLNNLITVIRGNLTLSREQLSETNPAQRNLFAAEQAATQLRPLVGQLAYLQQPVDKEEFTDLEDLARECLAICLGHSPIKGQLEAQAGLPPVAMGRSSVARILNNLLINAREAMPQGGQVVLRLFLAGEMEWLHGSVQSGDYVCFEVEDNGPGIAADVLDRIFEANYSQKLWGQGLGLYGSRTLAEAKGGTLTVNSSQGKGATFRLFLPIKAI